VQERESLLHGDSRSAGEREEDPLSATDPAFTAPTTPSASSAIVKVAESTASDTSDAFDAHAAQKPKSCIEWSGRVRRAAPLCIKVHRILSWPVDMLFLYTVPSPVNPSCDPERGCCRRPSKSRPSADEHGAIEATKHKPKSRPPSITTKPSQAVVERKADGDSDLAASGAASAVTASALSCSECASAADGFGSLADDLSAQPIYSFLVCTVWMGVLEFAIMQLSIRLDCAGGVHHTVAGTLVTSFAASFPTITTMVHTLLLACTLASLLCNVACV
jgi:hypothetical protein